MVRKLYDALEIWMIAFVFFAISGVLWKKYHDWPTLHSVADGFFIAGVLMLFVDPLLKKQFFKEASKGIFVHLLGFEHHPQVKDKLKELVFETKLLRARFDARITVEPLPNDRYGVTVDYDSEIINPTNTAVSFDPYLEFDAGQHAEVLRMSFTSTDQKACANELNPPLKEKKDDPGVLSAKLKNVDVKPSSSQVTYHGSGTYRIDVGYPFYSFYMGIPTLRASIRLTVPDGYDVSATPADAENPNYWEYHKIRMVGDHFTIRWKRHNEEWNR
jgi:hypothetical protein